MILVVPDGLEASTMDPVAFIDTTEPCSDRSRGGSSMSSSHYELSGNADPSNDEFKQKVEQVLLIMNFFFLLQMSSSHYELFWKC
ncbi:hypothetical protein F3Y22_tig00110694pilonHSYRG00396 [Hibiscus syriacus]|uniref:Uncharacterized protein n=1 Tax=Hibiscus syriacus TaxID=106335 RepID=A0A6A2ZWQ5_HIBSY|nr:hypothetical protein F3Y22_tig00110694pilonHSYRG00396 [Hibiscus syriacus]